MNWAIFGAKSSLVVPAKKKQEHKPKFKFGSKIGFNFRFYVPHWTIFGIKNSPVELSNQKINKKIEFKLEFGFYAPH